MELNDIILGKTLHYMIEEFIINIKSCFEHEELDLKKVFCEVIKRNESIAKDLRSIAIHAHTTIETTDVSDMKMQLKKKIGELINNLLQQDFVELAFNRDEEYCIPSESDLHNFLHSAAMADITNFTASSLSLGSTFSFHLPSIASNAISDLDDIDPNIRNLNCLQSSLLFENLRMQFQDELYELKRILKDGFSPSDLNNFNAATILKYEHGDVVERNKSYSKNLASPFIPDNITEMHKPFTEFDLEKLNDLNSSNLDSFLCWENCLGKFFLDHFYISEITPETALHNISEKESQIYHSVLNPYYAISEDDMVYDILDLLIGIPSNTFFYDIHAHKFRIKSGVHLPSLSPECTSQFVGKFIESGSIYYLLSKFSNDFVHANDGLILKGLQLGIQHILSIYKEYIATIKANSPNMLYLRYEVLQNAEMLQTFGILCGIDAEKMIFKEIPKGLSLLSYLHDIALSHKRKENGVMIAVLLKFAYSPYFNFLNRWMTEGICDDPYEEFQIIEDFNYLGRKDALYWKFAYTENIDDPSRVVPPEIKSYSEAILDCGKSIALLNICCPDMFSLKFLFLKPPPPLYMVFSLPAVTCKLEESAQYILMKEQTEEIFNSESSKVSVENFYTDCQKFVNRKIMMKLMQRRWNLLTTKRKKSNLLCSNKVEYYYKEKKSSECTENLKVTQKRYNSLCSLNSEDTDYNFSGKIFGNIGVLFSSCGYVETNDSCNVEELEIDFTFNFCKQLDMMSYTEVFSDDLLKYMHTKCVEFSSNSEIKFLKSINQISCQDSEKTTNNDIPMGQNEFDKFFPQKICSKMNKSKYFNLSHSIKKGKKSLNSFMEKLASLLVSKYGDSVEDVCSCIEVTSLQHLMMHNFNAVLKMRIHLIEKIVKKYFVNKLRLDHLFSSLQKIYFFHDESFSQSLCEHLFVLVMKCKTPKEFANWAVLSEILQNAISDSKQENNPFFESVNANIYPMSDEMPVERTEFLRLFKIEFEVNWPLNIIVHQTSIQQYLKIFSALLEIEFLSWFLGCIWRSLILSSKELHLNYSPQFREIMLNRFHMEQFIKVIRSSIHHHLQGPLLEYLNKGLSVEELNIDGLESIHMQYLEKALARCFLTAETHVLHELLTVMFRQIYKFCSALFECNWRKNNETGQYEIYIFNNLSSYVDTFKQYQRVFLKRILKETLTKKFGRYWDKDYQDFLYTILETERNLI